MDGQKILNDDIFSFIEKIITRKENYKYFKEDVKKYRELLKQCSTIQGPDKINVRCLCYQGKNDTDLLHLFEPYTDNDKLELIDETNVADILPKMDENITKMDEIIQNSDIVNDTNYIINVDDEITSDSLINFIDGQLPQSVLPAPSGTRFKNNQKGGYKKQVSFDNSVSENDNKKSLTLSKRQKLESKLNARWADEIKDLGKQLKIKPQRGKKNLSKTYVTKKILASPDLYDQALKILYKMSQLNSDTGSESS